MTIQPGETGTLHFEATVRDLIYQDSDDDAYASIEFAPTWFDSEFVHGPTRLEVNFHLPPGVERGGAPLSRRSLHHAGFRG